ncbi:UDP-glycosyltransferase 71K1-like [Fagus crenata]
MKQAELIFVPIPGIGHLISTIEFAKRLIDRDDRILITILSMKFPFTPTSDAYTSLLIASQPQIQLIDLPQVEPPTSDLWTSPEHYITLFIENNIPNIKNIVTDIVSSKSDSASSRVVGLVLDFFCMSVIDVGRELSLPSYLFLTANAGFLGLMLCLPSRHDQIGTEFSESDPEFLIPGIINPVPSGVLPLAAFNKDGGYAAYLKVAQRFRDTKGIMVNTFRKLEPYALDSLSDGQTPPIYAVGPMLDLKCPPNPELDKAQGLQEKRLVTQLTTSWIVGSRNKKDQNQRAKMNQVELIFVPVPGIGHLVSTIEFAKRLIDHNDRILITILSMKFPFTPTADAYTSLLIASQPQIQLIDLPRVEPPSSDLWSSPEYYISLFIDSNIPNVKDAVTKIVSSNSNSNSA